MRARWPAGLLRSRKLRFPEVKSFVQGHRAAHRKARAGYRLPDVSSLIACRPTSLYFHPGTSQHASGLRAKGKNLVEV